MKLVLEESGDMTVTVFHTHRCLSRAHVLPASIVQNRDKLLGLSNAKLRSSLRSPHYLKDCRSLNFALPIPLLAKGVRIEWKRDKAGTSAEDRARPRFKGNRGMAYVKAYRQPLS